MPNPHPSTPLRASFLQKRRGMGHPCPIWGPGARLVTCLWFPAEVSDEERLYLGRDFGRRFRVGCRGCSSAARDKARRGGGAGGPPAASLTFIGNAFAAKIFLQERVDRRRWFAAVLVAAGVVLLA